MSQEMHAAKMRTQRKMSQMKEQDKKEKKLKDMETNNLPDTEFKHWL